jgi:hypothetical protein
MLSTPMGKIFFKILATFAAKARPLNDDVRGRMLGACPLDLTEARECSL